MEEARSLFQQQRADLDHAITMAGLMPGARTFERISDPAKGNP
jgi:hypothetical protein